MVLSNTVRRIESISRETFSRLVEVQRRGVDIVWSDPRLEPQEIFDAMGDNAVKVVQYWSALTEFITELAAVEDVNVELKYPTNAFTLSGAKVVVSDDPYEG
jgi:hypothetical protein